MGKRRQPLTSPPTQPGGLALDDPFVRGLGLIQLVYGGLNHDFAVNRPLQSRATLPVARADTLQMVSTDVGSYRICADSEKTQEFTTAVLVRLVGGNTDYCPIIGLMYNAAGNEPYGDQIDMVTGRPRFAYNKSGTARSTPVADVYVPTTEFMWIFCRLTEGRQQMIINGALSKEMYDTGGIIYSPTSSIGIGSINADGRNPGVEIKVALRCDRWISDAEMYAIMADPNRLAANPRRRRVARRGLFGPTYTFPLGAGSFASTGQAAALKAARKLTAAAGSFAMAGVAAALKASRKLQAATGSFTVAGQAASLKASRKLTADLGAFTSTGNAASIKAARLMQMSTGAFTLTGNTANFVYTPVVGPVGPTYTMTGAAGNFVLSGSAARLLIARRLVVSGGSYSMAGGQVSLVAARRISFAPSAFAVAGNAAGLRSARRLLAAAGSFALTGNTATLLYTPVPAPGGPTYTLTAVGGAFGLIGSSAGMRAHRRLLGDVGQFILTGRDAGLSIRQKIEYARAPAGNGYAPRRIESQTRPGSASTARPAATQRNDR